VLARAAARARGELRGEAGGQQELEPERQGVRAAGLGRLCVEQRELIGQQVVDAAMRVAVVEQAPDRVAAARRDVERPRVLAQPRVTGDGLGARDRQQVRTPLVEHEVQAEERLQAPAEARARAAHALGDGT
jgi:hypothetical protein